MAIYNEAGRYDTLAVIERRDESTVNDMNEPVPVWEELCQSWVRELPASGGREYVEAGQTRALITRTFRTRWNPTMAQVTSKDRLVIGGSTIEIVAVNDIERRRIELEIVGRE